MFADKLIFALYVTVIGLAVVFAVLVILVFFAKIVKYANLIPSRADLKKRRAEKRMTLADKAAEAAPEPEKAEALQTDAAPRTDEGELQAVIAAAIAAYMEQADGSAKTALCPNGIVVRSVRRAGGFNSASRNERLNNRI